MDRSPRSWALLALLGMSAASAMGCSPRSSEAVREPSAVDEFASTIVCNEYTNIDDREMYVVSAINRKLRYYPEFANAIGIHSVTDCASARAFAAGYEQYQTEHPHFDALQPRAAIPNLPPLPPQPAQTVTVPKIFNGSFPGTFNYPHNPIVSLIWPRRIFTLSDDNIDVAICSGTFIGKNFIATAAHCLERVHIAEDPLSTNQFTDPLLGYTNVTIAWAGPTGSTNPLDGGNRINLPGNNVLQIPDDLYLGSAGSKSDHDFAILVLNPTVWDPYLPPRSDDGSVMRLSMSSPVIPPNCNPTQYTNCQRGFFGGYGDDTLKQEDFFHFIPDGGRGGDGGYVVNDSNTVLANLTNKPLRIGSDYIVQVGGTITKTGASIDGGTRTTTEALENSFVTVPHDATTNVDGTFCHGDSGGAAYRQIDLGGTQGMMPLLLGVISQGDTNGFARSDGKPGGLPCMRTGFNMLISSIDKQADRGRPQYDFIEKIMRRWYSNDAFSCKIVLEPANTGNLGYLECWGQPCQDDMDCGANGYCDQQPLEVALNAPRAVCPICSQLSLPTGASGCDCVYGQCLPKKTSLQ